jgi:hypothetical protein
MKPRPHKVIRFIFQVVSQKSSLFFWMLIRFISAVFPLVTIYQFSEVIKQIETGQPLNKVLTSVVWIFIIRVVDNILRLKSITRLEHEISGVAFDIHNYFLTSLKTQTKEERHSIVQAIRNFADASATTLNLVKQPGIDSLVSFLFIPVILYTLDVRTFVLTITYILIYLVIDRYTTDHYATLKDHLNYKTESYFAKLQESDDFELEQKAWTRHFHRITNWAFTEWSLLQNLSVFFYGLIFFYLILATSSGIHQISNLVLIMGYVTQTQVFLNSFTAIQDSLTDMLVGLERLAANHSVSAIDLDDLI